MLSEKYNALADKLKQYTFIVDRKATKDDIRAEIEKVFNVKVNAVRTMIYGGTKKTRYTKKGIIQGKTAAYKKAVVTLLDDGSIDFYSNI